MANAHMQVLLTIGAGMPNKWRRIASVVIAVSVPVCSSRGDAATFQALSIAAMAKGEPRLKLDSALVGETVEGSTRLQLVVDTFIGFRDHTSHTATIPSWDVTAKLEPEDVNKLGINWNRGLLKAYTHSVQRHQTLRGLHGPPFFDLRFKVRRRGWGRD
ncbi:hypothetical protein BC827DRAFT_1285886 [Russula dissimulans]|nr:hypothetical protein BC827DRAFT_1285886 [Russula dissimulans]